MNTIQMQFGDTAQRIEQLTWEGKVCLALAYAIAWGFIFNLAS